MENMEIERKFLVNELPKDLESYPHSELWQGYLCMQPTVRIRRDGDAFYLTYKGKGSLAREEYNLPLTEAAFAHLQTKIDFLPVEKTRYRIPCGAYTVELDLFHGRHEGKLLAEVEFPSAAEALAFEAPAWLGEDVTSDPAWRNTYLAKH